MDLGGSDRTSALLTTRRAVERVSRSPIGVDVSSVKRWKRAAAAGGYEALAAKPNRGRPSRLTPEQKQLLKQETGKEGDTVELTVKELEERIAPRAVMEL